MQEVRINNEAIKVESIDKENVIWKWTTRLGGLLGGGNNCSSTFSNTIY